jgi:hypothetical protein
LVEGVENVFAFGTVVLHEGECPEMKGASVISWFFSGTVLEQHCSGQRCYAEKRYEEDDPLLHGREDCMKGGS